MTRKHPGTLPPLSAPPPPLLLLLLLLFAATTSLIPEAEGALTYPCPHPPPPPPKTPTAPPSSPDLMPRLPEQFVMHVEANIVQEQRTTEAIEVFDYPNQRAAVSTTSQNQTVTSIFSYKTGERLDIFANGTCVTRNLSDASFDVFGFTELKASGGPHIVSAAGVFRLGDAAQKVFLGEDTVRGIPVYHWQSCQSLKADGLTKAAYVIDYYFSKTGYNTATADTMVPVRALVNGTAINVDAKGKPSGGTHDFSHVYDFSFFRPGPIVDASLFEVPRGTVCNRLLSKTLPQLPDQFSLSMEVLVGGSVAPPRTERMLFDYGFGLIQTERFAPRGTGERFGLTELTIVEDYNNHLQYVVDSYHGNCSISALPDGLSTSEGGEGSEITMKHAQELLKYGQRDFRYQGQRVLRDMKVDVWAASTGGDGDGGGMVQEVYFLADWPTPRLRNKLKNMASDLDLSRMNLLVGTYLLNTSAIRQNLGPFFQLFQDKALKQWGDRWQRQSFKPASSSSSSSVSSSSPPLPPPGDLLRSRMSRRRFRWDSARMHFRHASEKMIHIFNYLPMHMDLSAFDVSQCYTKNSGETYILFAVEESYASVVTDQRSIFLSAVRSSVATAADVSMLRVTNVNVWQDMVSRRLNIFFYLLEPPPVFNNAPRQLPSQDALKNLQGAVSKGLTITVKHALKHHELTVVPGSLKNWDSLSELWNKVLPGSKAASAMAGGGGGGAGNVISETHVHEAGQPDPKGSGSSGYTAGQFGGMAFAMLVVGAGVGVGGLYLVLRRLRPDIHLLPYQQTN
ncbi:hypothetical protein ACOMHN_007857 [Nucella lapillus]